MIQGTFGDDGELFFEIELITNAELELPVDALLDTGFSEWLVINKQDLSGLGWLYVYKLAMQMAQDISSFDIYTGKVRIAQQGCGKENLNLQFFKSNIANSLVQR